MKKIAIGAIAAVIAALSLSTAAEARPHWQHRGWNHHSGWNHHGGRHAGWHHSGWRHHGYRGGPFWGAPFWGGPAIVIGGPVYDDYCFVRKVRHHDRHGNLYVTRVRVCD